MSLIVYKIAQPLLILTQSSMQPQIQQRVCVYPAWHHA